MASCKTGDVTPPKDANCPTVRVCRRSSVVYHLHTASVCIDLIRTISSGRERRPDANKRESPRSPQAIRNRTDGVGRLWAKSRLEQAEFVQGTLILDQHYQLLTCGAHKARPPHVWSWRTQR